MSLRVFSCGGCGDSPSDAVTKTLFINSRLVDRVGVGPQTWMQVEKNEDGRRGFLVTTWRALRFKNKDRY